MRCLRAWLTASFVAVYVFVAAVPCEPGGEVGRLARGAAIASAADSHPATDAVEDEHAGCHTPPDTQWIPRCPCGCGGAEGGDTSTTPLGVALLEAPDDWIAASATARIAHDEGREPASPDARLEPVPI